MNTQASEIIDKLGGTAEVARLCQVKMPSVSDWRTTGIPRARLMYLRAIRPDVFGIEAYPKEEKAPPARIPALNPLDLSHSDQERRDDTDRRDDDRRAQQQRAVEERCTLYPAA